MHSTVTQTAIATAVVTSDRPTIQTPQRKANYKDKNRPRRKDLKALAFNKYGCSCTSTVKKYLKVLGINLDLRLTAAWKAVVYELHDQIVAAKAIVDALQPVPTPRIKKGDRVTITDCPPSLSYWSPFVVASVKSNMAQLEYVAVPFSLEQLELVS